MQTATAQNPQNQQNPQNPQNPHTPAPSTPAKIVKFTKIAATLLALGALVAFYAGSNAAFYALFAALAVLLFALFEPYYRARKLAMTNAVYKRGSLLSWLFSRLFLTRVLTLVSSGVLAATLTFALCFPTGFDVFYGAILLPLSLLLLPRSQAFFATQLHADFAENRARVYLAAALAAVGVVGVFACDFALFPTPIDANALQKLSESTWGAIQAQQAELFKKYPNLDAFLELILTLTTYKKAALIVGAHIMDEARLGGVGAMAFYCIVTAIGSFAAFYAFSLAILSADFSFIFAKMDEKSAQNTDENSSTNPAQNANQSSENPAAPAAPEPNSNLAQTARARRAITFTALFFAAVVMAGWGQRFAIKDKTDKNALGRRLLPTKNIANVTLNDEHHWLETDTLDALIKQAHDYDLQAALDKDAAAILAKYFADEEKIIHEFSDWYFSIWAGYVRLANSVASVFSDSVKDDASEKLNELFVKHAGFDLQNEYVKRANDQIAQVLGELAGALREKSEAEAQSWRGGSYIEGAAFNVDLDLSLAQEFAKLAQLRTADAAGMLAAASAAALIANPKYLAKISNTAGLLAEQAGAAGGRTLGRLGAARLGANVASGGRAAKNALSLGGRRVASAAAASPCAITTIFAGVCAVLVFGATEFLFNAADKAINQEDLENRLRAILAEQKSNLAAQFKAANAKNAAALKDSLASAIATPADEAALSGESAAPAAD